MTVRRFFYRWQFVAAAVLPIWLLIGYASFGTSVAGFLAVVLLAPLALVVELALALLLSARTGVRRAKALDWPAIGLLAAFQAGVIGIGFFGPATAWFGVLAAAAAIAGFWLGGRLLVEDVRTRVRTTFGGPAVPGDRRPIDAGEYVVIKPSSH
ncbi:hypothetical protein [Amnibacterium endophyticum]|uniref:MFS transporter n=1 Tax=Amnibacterium endophyticum TaxID=2109337 RepID=A0ABW4LFX4_9MICO